MPLLILVVEGTTEAAVVVRVISPHLRELGITTSAPRVVGGNRWPTVLRDLREHLRANEHRSAVTITTMFDFVRMNQDQWPGRREASRAPMERRAANVEDAMVAAVHRAIGAELPPGRFIPYVQMHELEALILARPAELARRLGADGNSLQALSGDIEGQPPESINDGDATKPSARIRRFFPRYNKTVHGPPILQSIGLPALRAACPHFHAWITRLESLASSQP